MTDRQQLEKYLELFKNAEAMQVKEYRLTQRDIRILRISLLSTLLANAELRLQNQQLQQQNISLKASREVSLDGGVI